VGKPGAEKNAQQQERPRAFQQTPFWHVAALASKLAGANDQPCGHRHKRQRPGMPSTPLWNKLVHELHLPVDVVAGVLAGMQSVFGEGRARELAMEPWFCDLAPWGEFEKEVAPLCAGAVGPAMPLVVESAAALSFAVVRIVCKVRAADVQTAVTDNGKLNELKRAGWSWRRGEIWGESDCLIDSLLQILIALGVVAGPPPSGTITETQREDACKAVRQELLQQPATMPRDGYGAPVWNAYLQHHRHAAVVIQHLVRLFPHGEGLRREGMVLVVHARYDTAELPPERLELLPGVGAGSGPALEMHVFNWTGQGLDGYHYDPLLPGAPAHQVVDLEAEDVFPPSSSKPQTSAVSREPLLKRRKGDGLGRAILSATAEGPPPASSAGSAASSSTYATVRQNVVVSGFGDERCADVDRQRAQLDRGERQRARDRRETGRAGRARDIDNRDLDRGAGGAWHAGR